MNCLWRGLMHNCWCILFGVCAVLCSPSEAFAYLDPGTGSYVFQILIAFIVGAIFSIKVYWRKIVAVFRRTFRGSEKNKDKQDIENHQPEAEHIETDPS